MMVRNKEEIEILIGIFLKGEATPQQAIELEDWRLESQENGQLFYQLEKVFSLTHKIPIFIQPNVDKAWGNVENNFKINTPKKRYKYLLYAAAAVLVIFFLYNGLYNSKEASKNEIVEIPLIDSTDVNRVILASNAIKSFTLEDQSIVNLELGSKLILDKNFNKKNRIVELDGSGKFTVIHNDSKPFILKVSGLEVYDIGTVFSIKNTRDTIKVTVEEGEVELRLNGNIIAVKAGDSAFYLVSKQIISLYKTPEERKDHTFVFDGTTLKEVASILSSFYNRKIEIMDAKIAECPLSVTFKNENLATILDIIKELMDVKIIHKSETIGIYGKGCN